MKVAIRYISSSIRGDNVVKVIDFLREIIRGHIDSAGFAVNLKRRFVDKFIKVYFCICSDGRSVLMLVNSVLLVVVGEGGEAIWAVQHLMDIRLLLLVSLAHEMLVLAILDRVVEDLLAH